MAEVLDQIDLVVVMMLGMLKMQLTSYLLQVHELFRTSTTLAGKLDPLEHVLKLCWVVKDR